MDIDQTCLISDQRTFIISFVGNSVTTHSHFEGIYKKPPPSCKTDSWTLSMIKSLVVVRLKEDERL